MIVFVSSTYRDLVEYREVLRVALETSGHQFRGMEHFPAQPSPPLEVALAALNECEVYVGIIGELYGSSPPRRVLSYTELEYNYATEIGMDKIILVMDDNAQVDPSRVEHDPAKLERLGRFRSRIMRDHLIQNFDSPHEAAWKILAALRQHEIRLREEQG